jgi:hypothetical protein
MGKHEHKHSCECSHESVKFCRTCKVVHCLGCNQEWGLRVQSYYQYPWSYTYDGLLKTGSGTSFGPPSQQTDSTGFAPAQTHETYCCTNHSDDTDWVKKLQEFRDQTQDLSKCGHSGE